MFPKPKLNRFHTTFLLNASVCLVFRSESSPYLISLGICRMTVLVPCPELLTFTFI